MFEKELNNVRIVKPTVHTITNTVAASLCANALLAISAYPIMADSPLEAAEIAAGTDGVCLNLGMPNPDKIEAMLQAGKTANASGHPVVFDPVGAGASKFRQNVAKAILNEVNVSLIRGNLSELRALLIEDITSKGVDVSVKDEHLKESETLEVLKKLADKTGSLVALSGKRDLVTDGKRVIAIDNGDERMSKISGSGCALSALLAAFLAANPENPLQAAAAGMIVYGIAGERAANRLKIEEGCGSLPVYLLDELDHFDEAILNEGAKYEIF